MEDSEMFALVIVILLGLIVLTIIFAQSADKKLDKELQEEQRKKAEAQELELKRQRELAERIKKQEQEEALLYQNRFGSYGNKTVDILVGKNEKDFSSHFYVFEEAGILVVDNKDVRFEDVIGFNLQDNSEMIATTSESVCVTETTRSTVDVLGRAAVGGLLFGREGAVVGALTADEDTVSRKVEPSMTTTVIRHDYVIYINVNDLSNHTLRVHVGEDEEKTNRIVNVLNVIVLRNQKKN